ncbi:uncharacterized protein TRIADDRAFT_55515 [Trichoplax adhaerens]|uniref:Uncharacterized protein n=1 Tax=Trichoplax adhaerens TaxID=10228 RepID=B3RV38_TRIAD|nr:hypothetical protein TRIADDRAFT_55515 [Trichoplax adhaerens]EDV25432.1 hypothetical protein TRIADDRAFT_55515 [Trichoplax adhaerens]|eukprot:XP_002111465.1 hypothetical protein TRIADDRAFT_55515 [Trichoplax adhaerens]
MADSSSPMASTQTQVKVVDPSKKIWCSSRDTIAASERGVVTRRNKKVERPSNHIIEEVIEPLHLLGAFVGYHSPKYKTLASICLFLFYLNLIISSTFIVYFTAINLYLIVYCIVAVMYTLSAGLCAYYVNTRTLPYIEKSIKALYRDKLYIDSLESVRELNKPSTSLNPILSLDSFCAFIGPLDSKFKIGLQQQDTRYQCASENWLSLANFNTWMISIMEKYTIALPVLAILLAVLELGCHVIAGVNAFARIKYHIGYGIIIPIHFLRFISLFHITYAYCYFMACAVTLMSLTGLSMRQWTEQAGSVLRVSPPEISFGEAVHSFGLRSTFVSDASKACEGMLTVTFIISFSSIVLNSYNFLFTERCGVYLWSVVICLSQVITPLAVSAWATKAYHDYTLIVVQAWVTQPDEDDIKEMEKQKSMQSGDSPRKRTWKDVLRKNTKINPGAQNILNTGNNLAPPSSDTNSPQATHHNRTNKLGNNEDDNSSAPEESNSPRSNLLLKLKNLKSNEELTPTQDESVSNTNITLNSPRSNLLSKLKNLKENDQLPPTPIQSLRKSSSSNSLQIKEFRDSLTNNNNNNNDVVIPMEPLSDKESPTTNTNGSGIDITAGSEGGVKKRNPWKLALDTAKDEKESFNNADVSKLNTSVGDGGSDSNEGPLPSPVKEEKVVKEKNNQFLNLIRGVGLVAGKLRRKRNQQRLNFEKYITYLQSIKSETGFSVIRSVMTWGGVSNFVFIVFSAVAVFAQEAIFGDATDRNVNACLNKTVIFLQNL